MVICAENSYPDFRVIMLKRFGIFIFILLFWALGGRCFAQSQFSSTLTTMEKSLFGVDYSSQNDDARLKRLEETVYGQASSKPMQQRVSKLSTDLSADLMGHEIKPTADTFADEKDAIKEEIPKADPNINYPIVNSLEDRVFHKEFKTTDINQRLASLEQSVFKKTYNDDLNSRVDRLRTAVMPERIAAGDSEDNFSSLPDDLYSLSPPLRGKQYSEPASDDDGSSTGYGSAIPTYNSQNSVLDGYQTNPSVTISLAALEKSILKKSFPDDTVSNRLTRLELNMFNSTFVDDDPETRVDRISSAYHAKKTSKKYDDNKFTQHVSTAMQIGAVLLMILAAVL